MTRVGYFLSCEENPPAELIRQARLAEQAGFEALWISDHFHHHGKHYDVDTARLYTLPERLPSIYMSGFGDKAATLAGRIADGFISVEPDPDLATAGSAKPTQGGLKVCWTPDAADARKTAHRLWPNDQIPGEAAQLLPLPRHFGQLAELIPEEMVRQNLPCGPDPQTHLQALQDYIDAGYDDVYVNQIGPDQEGFFTFYAEQVLPELKNRG